MILAPALQMFTVRSYKTLSPQLKDRNAVHIVRSPQFQAPFAAVKNRFMPDGISNFIFINLLFCEQTIRQHC